MCYAVYLSPGGDWAIQESMGGGKRFSIKTLNSHS